MKRDYESRSYYNDLIKSWIDENKQAIINYMMYQLKYDDLEKLKSDDISMKWGFDCGFCYLIPRNKEMREEWKKYDDWDRLLCPVAYETQSITAKEPQVKYIIEELKLSDLFYLYSVLD